MITTEVESSLAATITTVRSDITRTVAAVISAAYFFLMFPLLHRGRDDEITLMQ